MKNNSEFKECEAIIETGGYWTTGKKISTHEWELNPQHSSRRCGIKAQLRATFDTMELYYCDTCWGKVQSRLWRELGYGES